MIKGFRQIASLTVVSRILGMVRDMAFAFFFGRGELMDIWTIAFKIPNLSRRIFGEGAAASSLIPVYSEELAKNPQQSQILARTVVTVIFAILTVIVLVGEIVIWWYCKYYADLPGTRLMLTLTAVMLPYMCLICSVAILAGLLNSHGHFAMPAAAPIVLNTIIIGALALGGWILNVPAVQHLFITAIGVLTAGAAQIVIQLIPLRKYGIPLRPAWEVKTQAFKKIMILMGPMILGLTVTQLNTLADDVIARCLSGSEEKGTYFMWYGKQVAYPVWSGAVSSLFYAQRLYQFPLGVLGISLATAIFPVLSAAAAKKDEALLSQTVRRGIQAAFFVALPATVGLMLISRPLIAVLFQRGEFAPQDTRAVQGVLVFYAIGLSGYFLQQVVTRAFYAVQDSRWPARTAMLAVFVNVVLNLTLIWKMKAAGLALATALCSYLQVSILLAVLHRKFNISFRKHTLEVLVKTAIATAAMAGAGWLCSLAMSGITERKIGDLIRILVIVVVCSCVYMFISHLLKNEMLGLLLKRGKKEPEKL